MSVPALSAVLTPPTLDADGKIAAVNIVVVGEEGRAQIWRTSQTPPQLVAELKEHESDAEVT